MPVIRVSAPDLGDADELVTRLADACATALALGYGDVVATFAPTTSTATSGGGLLEGVWPIVSFHGGRRGDELEERARAAAAEVVTAWSSERGAIVHGIWTEWIPPTPDIP